MGLLEASWIVSIIFIRSTDKRRAHGFDDLAPQQRPLAIVLGEGNFIGPDVWYLIGAQ
ncbi:hypothetical protein X771_01760 [Mesorhizobium sp. LSJC277A00]|nr:hypothetical protein X771_01760 [Mesorhizobium sp. LSJC277A00]